MNQQINAALKSSAVILRSPLVHAKLWRDGKENGTLHEIPSFLLYLELQNLGNLSQGRRVHVRAESCMLRFNEMQRKIYDPAFISYAVGYEEVSRQKGSA